MVQAAGTVPVNLVLNAPFLTVARAGDLGVRRISVGRHPARRPRAARGGNRLLLHRLPDVEALFRDDV